MSSISGLTAQAQSIGGCTPQDCCNQIAALSARVSALEGDSGTARTALQRAGDALSQAGIAKAQADTLTGEVNILQSGYAELLALAGGAFALARAAMATAAALGPAIAGLGARLVALAAGLASLQALVLPLIVAVAGIGAIALSIAAAQTAADSAYSLAETALRIAGSASDQASTAILRSGAAQAAADAANRIGAAAGDLARAAQSTANRAIGAASDAKSTADRAITTASDAQSTADRAITTASGAQSTADRAITTASGAQSTADRAITTASDAKSTADRAITTASDAKSTADRAITTASGAQSTADRAITTASGAQSTADRAIGAASDAKSTADRAITTASGAKSTADRAITTASGAKSTADRAIAIASSIAARPSVAGRDGRDGAVGTRGATGERGLDGAPGANGRDGAPGAIGNPGAAGANGRDGAPGATGANGRDGAPGATGNPGITTIINQNTVNPGKEDEIIRLLQGTNLNVLAIPGALIASTQFRSAAISAAAAGSCQSSKPGGCPGGGADQINNLGNRLNGISSAVGLLNNQILGTVTSTLNVINTKLGSQIVGGLSAWSKGISEVVNKSQILNVLTYISVLHNAYMLSNALSQTLFSAISNGLAALGLKDTSVDPNGTPFNIGKIVGQFTESFFVSIFGTGTVNGIKSDWKKYSRIYQAAAQVMYSVQSIGHSILGAMEVVGSHVAKIGNALQKFRLVGEKAYSWMNPTPFFQNRFFTGLQATQEVVSQIDQVASQALSIQETATQLGKNNDDLMKSVGQVTDSKQAVPTPEAQAVKAAADTAKAASVSPVIPESSIPKP